MQVFPPLIINYIGIQTLFRITFDLSNVVYFFKECTYNSLLLYRLDNQPLHHNTSSTMIEFNFFLLLFSESEYVFHYEHVLMIAARWLKKIQSMHFCICVIISLSFFFFFVL